MRQDGIDALSGLRRWLVVQLEEIGPLDDTIMRHRTRTGTIRENLPMRSRTVQSIHRAYLAVPEAVSGVGKFYGNEWVCVDGIELHPIVENLIDKLLADGKRQEFMLHNPLVVPPDETPCLVEDIGSRDALLSKMVNNRVVKLEEGQVQLRNEQMHIVAWISNQRSSLAIPWKIIFLAHIVDAEQEFVEIIEVVEMWVTRGACAVDTFQVQARHAEVAQFVEASVMQKHAAVGGDVVRD